MREKKVDLNLGKVPPHSKEFETAILGICMLEKHAFATANQYLFADVFYLDAHKNIYAAYCSLFDENKPIDLLTVVQQLKESGNLEAVGGAYYITTLTNAVTSSAHLEDWCKAILELYMKREGIRITGELMIECYNDEADAFEVFNKADNQIINIQERVLRGQIADIDHYARKVYEQYEAVKETGVLGLKTGIEPIDKLFCGLVPPDLFIIAARPGAGKTALALSITKNMSCDQNIAGAWFSLEMDGSQLVRRLASMISNVDHSDIRNGRVRPELESHFYNTLDLISKKPIYIEDKGSLNIRDLRARAIVLKRKHDIQYIVVDYMQLMSPIDPKNQNRNDVVGEISRGLKMLAKELSIPVVALAQLSRAVESRSDKVPQLSDLRESGSIEQDADCVLFLMRPEYYGMMNEMEIDGREYSPYGLCVGIAGKNRHGSTKNIAMKFVHQTMLICNHDDGLDTYKALPPQNNFPTQHNIQSARNVLGEKSGDFDEGTDIAELF